jgi:hypothetical protein
VHERGHHRRADKASNISFVKFIFDVIAKNPEVHMLPIRWVHPPWRNIELRKRQSLFRDRE